MTDDMRNIRIELDESAFERSLISDIEAALAEPAKPSDAPQPDAEAPGQPQWIGKVLGHFKLIRLIGQGSMGFVVQAMDVHLQRIVALKVLRKRIEGLAEENRTRQFLREAQAAARIEHPNVIQVYEISQHEGWWYIAMEWLEGQDLRRVVRAAGPLPPARACPVVADAATALSVAHESGIIHRDVKPSNLMITRTGRCKLTDFGFVRMNDPGDPFDFTDRSVGTPQFMAPEVIQGHQPTAAVDVYSLGATLHYALLGRAPYVGGTVSEICKQHLNAPPPDIRKHLAMCPVSLARLIERAMAKDPADRPSAAEMAAALHAEAVASRPDDSGILSVGSSTVIGQLVSDAAASTVAMAPLGPDGGPVAERPAGPARSVFFRPLLVLVCLVAAIIAAWGGWHLLRDRPGRGVGPAHRGAGVLAERFPGAADTYGVLSPGEICRSDEPNAPAPPFSWVHRVETTGLRFVASRRGGHYYRIDDPAAVLIRAEDFVGYRTAAEARADAKTAAP